MPQAGQQVILPTGARGVLSTGRAAIYNAQGQCPECCAPPPPPECVPIVLGEHTLRLDDAIFWLEEYQGPGKAPPGAYWRIINVTACQPYYFPWYAAGCVSEQGELLGLPNFVSEWREEYWGQTLELQIGCPEEDSIVWPGECQTPTFRFGCGCIPRLLGGWYFDEERPVWDLTPYQGPNKAPPGAYWRIQDHECQIHLIGLVGAEGQLLGLPDEFRGQRDYLYYLQIGCQIGNWVYWPINIAPLGPHCGEPTEPP